MRGFGWGLWLAYFEGFLRSKRGVFGEIKCGLRVEDLRKCLVKVVLRGVVGLLKLERESGRFTTVFITGVKEKKASQG